MTNIPTVYELRKQNWKARVSHFRRYYRYCTYTGRKLERDNLLSSSSYVDQSGDIWLLSPKGGCTVITLRTPEGKEYAGNCICSNVDSYVRKFGVKKALARAYAAAILS